MATPNAIQWEIEADYLQACNCDYGCPCEFEAPPTMGFCEGAGAYRITKGNYGSVNLDGLSFAFVIKFPGPMHKGNGTLQMAFDARANAQQRQALLDMTSGKAGGMPFEAFAMIISKVLDPIFAPFNFNLNGRNSSVRIGDQIELAMEPIKNPVTGEEESIRIEHGTGFIFKSADCVSARQSQVSTGAINFSYPNKAGFVTRIRYSN